MARDSDFIPIKTLGNVALTNHFGNAELNLFTGVLVKTIFLLRFGL